MLDELSEEDGELAEQKEEADYEGWSMTARNNARSRRDLNGADYFREGFKGNIRIADDNNNTFDYVAWQNRTQEHPLYADDTKCHLGWEPG